MSRRSPPPRSRVARDRRAHALEPGTAAAGREVDIDITSIAAGGDGVGRADGVVVFTPRTAPGDHVRVRAVATRAGRLARGTVIDLLQPSPARVAPACTHYTRDRCGGCQLQHLRYDAQLEAKGGIVRDALTRIARRPTEHVVVHASPSQWRYRRKLTLALRRSAPGQWIGGLHRYDAPDEIFALEDCPITESDVIEVWHAVLRAADLLPDASELRAGIRTTADGYAFVVEGGREWAHAAQFAQAVPVLTEIWWQRARAARARAAPEKVEIQKVESRRAQGHRRPQGGCKAAGRGDACVALADQPVMIRPDTRTNHTTGASFVQINVGMAAALHADVVARALAHAPRTVADAYAGMGATALPLAERGVRVTTIEADPDAAAYCASRLPAGSRAITARVEDVAATLLAADVVILNPPRQGVASAVTSCLAVPRAPREQPRAIIYVSCDPATLARDVSRLIGWRVSAVSSFDMFPQTAHVETVCELVPEVEARA